MKVKLNHPKVIEMLAKCIVGDESPFPYRSGSKLVNFFNKLGYKDIYRSGFPTRWRYAEERIIQLTSQGKLKDVINLALSVDELIQFDEVELSTVENLQNEIIKYLNERVFSFTDMELVRLGGKFGLKKRVDAVPIGSGSFAEVFPVREGDKKYAVKRLKSEFWEDREVVHRFKREFELMKEYNHCEHTVEVYKFNEEELYYTMELADCTLEKFIKDNNHVMSLQWKEHICEKIIRGLMELHPKVIHRDLSYNNVLIVNNEPKLADFGLGKQNTKTYTFETVSEAGVGTAHFTDPIQLNNFKDASIQTDIYSLGKIIDYIFSGNLVSQDHKYSSIVIRATHRDLSKRYSTVDELYEAFLALKNTDIDYDPVEEITRMYSDGKIVTERLHKIFTRNDSGEVLFNLVLKDLQASIEIFNVFISQFEYDSEIVLEKMIEELHRSRLPFNDYDNFGRFAMRVLINLGTYCESAVKLSMVLEYVAHNVNRFSIQRLLESNKYNNNIPAIIRDRWKIR